MRQTVCDYWYGWEAELDGHVVDSYDHDFVPGCMKPDYTYNWTKRVSTFLAGPSGNYSFRIFYKDEDTQNPVFGDVRFSVKI